jgi:hypothetical protein
MRQVEIMKLLTLITIFICFFVQPIFAQKQPLRISTFLSYNSGHLLGLENSLRSSGKAKLKFNTKYDTANSASQLALNYDGYNDFTLDGSYLQYTKGIATFGIGKVDRQWSFSDNTSLILSNNARPSESIYLKLKNRFGYDWLPSKANWHFEIFNGFTYGSLNDTKSMLLGMRAILSPFEALEFELVQTSQWGGKDYDEGLSALGAALLTDTNSNSNANINKMAGFGISYTLPTKIIPLRVYAQAIGEDESGNFPSCFAHFVGLEWTNKKIKYPSIIGIESIDTRIDTTTNGNCGPNTMYNNSIYKFTNYGKTMGAAIDTEGTSLNLFVRSQISQKMNIEFATKSVVINDNNWSAHRLSSNRQSGLINSLGVSWIKNKINFHGDIYYQSFSLDKANIKSGYGVGFSSSMIF